MPISLSYEFFLFAAQAAAIVLEAMPFLLAGSFLGACVDVWLTPERVAKYAPKSLSGGVLTGCFAGAVLPTCECGVVPVVRRLLAKGVPSGAAFAYLLAGPVVNPVVIAATWFAFNGDWGLVVARVGMTLATAAVTAFALGKVPPEVALRGNLATAASGCGCGCGHDHGDQGHGGHDHAGHGCSHDHGSFNQVPMPLWARLGRTTAREFLAMGQFLVLGAIAAAAFRSFVPGEVVQSLAGNLPLAILGMMIMAVLLSICSEADAFVAASFAAFPWVSRIAFTSIGPMLDLKLIPMFWATFHPRIALVLTILPFCFIFLLATLLGYAWGQA